MMYIFCDNCDHDQNDHEEGILQCWNGHGTDKACECVSFKSQNAKYTKAQKKTLQKLNIIERIIHETNKAGWK